MRQTSRLGAAAALLLVLALSPTNSAALNTCIVPDASGTATLPNAMPTLNCPGGYLPVMDVYRIIDGLLGDTIEIDGSMTDFSCAASTVCSFAVTPPTDCNDPGGSLGGGKGCADLVFHTNMQGTGGLSGFSRMIDLPLEVEHQFGPHTPGNPIQTFDTVMFRLFGQITGDADFDLLRVVGGNDFGLPSPGHTLLGRSAPNWQMDSFFDITYRIDFVGAAGGALAGKSGSTTGTIRIQLGETITTVTTTTMGPPTTTTSTTLAPPVYDHLECFKAKDTLRVTGMVDLPTLAGSPYNAAGCKIIKVSKFCTPAQKNVLSSTPTATPMPGPDLTSDYICYKIKCPTVSLTQNADDQFGTHGLSKMKQGELCVPAVRMP